MKNITWKIKRSGNGMTVKTSFETNGAKVEQKFTDMTDVKCVGGKITAEDDSGAVVELSTGLQNVGLRTEGGVVINAELPAGTILYAYVP